jgi:hypothetical protein
MPNGLFQPKAPDLLGAAETILGIREKRRQRGLKQQAFNQQIQQFASKQQQEREKAIAAQKQQQFDQAATLLKNAPTPEIAVRSAQIMGDILGIQIDTDKLIKNLNLVQKGVGNVIKLSQAGQTQDASNLSIALMQQFSQVPGGEPASFGDIQKGIFEQLGEEKEKERRKGLLFAEEPIGVIKEEGIPITEPEGFVKRPTFLGEEVQERFGPLGTAAFIEKGFEGLEKLPKKPKLTKITSSVEKDGKIREQDFLLNPATGESEPFGKDRPLKKGARGKPPTVQKAILFDVDEQGNPTKQNATFDPVNGRFTAKGKKVPLTSADKGITIQLGQGGTTIQTEQPQTQPAKAAGVPSKEKYRSFRESQLGRKLTKEELDTEYDAFLKQVGAK